MQNLSPIGAIYVTFIIRILQKINILDIFLSGMAMVMCMGTGMAMGMGMSIGTGVGTGMFIRMGMGTGMSTGMGMENPLSQVE